MRTLAQAISILALAGTLAPPILYFTGALDLDQTKQTLLFATIAWFVATPFWMGRTPQATPPPGSE